jgi:hypothetical protein
VRDGAVLERGAMLLECGAAEGRGARGETRTGRRGASARRKKS